MPANKPWIQNYPAGVPAEVDIHQYASIPDVFAASVKRFGDRPAFINMGCTLTYREIDGQSRQFARFLIEDLALKRGDRVALMMPNLLQYPIALFGVLRAGLVVVNVNPLYTARELKHQLVDSGASALVVLEQFAQTVGEVLSQTPVKHVLIARVGDRLGFPKGLIANFVLKYVKKAIPTYRIDQARSFNDALARPADQFVDAKLSHDDLAFLQYTGGTTGVSKGAMLTHGNMVANMQQAHGWIGIIGKEGAEVVITALPLYHIFALTVNCLVFVKIGGANVLITNPRDMPGFVAELAKHKFTALTGVNTLFNGLINTTGFDKLDFSHLKLCVGGGAAVQRAVADKWVAVTAKPLIEGYGLTEAAPSVCMNPVNATAYSGTIGFPLPSTEIAIRDDDNNDVARGEIGELCVRGPQVMRGYWQRPDETAKVIDQNGWLHTGDMAKMSDAGEFQIVDRKKDMILVSGFNVYPNEIEDVVAQHPGVLEVAAVGVPDEKSGEAVKIVVVRKDPQLTADALKAYCREQLTGYKLPKIIEFRTELPKSNVGKILRRELR